VLQRTGDLANHLVVQFRLTGTALPGIDYKVVDGDTDEVVAVSSGIGEVTMTTVSKTLLLLPIDDDAAEGVESINVEIVDLGINGPYRPATGNLPPGQVAPAQTHPATAPVKLDDNVSVKSITVKVLTSQDPDLGDKGAPKDNNVAGFS